MIYTGTLTWVTSVKCWEQTSPNFSFIKNLSFGNSLAVQWLALGALTAGACTKIPQASRCSQKKKKKEKKRIWVLFEAFTLIQG